MCTVPGPADNPQEEQVAREKARQLGQRRVEEVLRGRDYRPWEGLPHIGTKVMTPPRSQDQ